MAARSWAAIGYVCAGVLLACSGQSAQAQAPAAAQAESAPPLSEQLQALARAKLLSLEAASAEQLRGLTAQAERLTLEGRNDEAVLVLLEALESPRFADFKDFPEYAAAEHMAGVALTKVGSLKSARRYLERAVLRGPDSAYYGPAVRRLTDVALELGDLEQAVAWLAQRESSMTEDARNELLYLRGRMYYDRGERDEAARLFERIGKRSRFYGNAQYLLGAIAADQKRYRNAEQRFCAVAGTGVENRYSFYVDQRFFEVQDLARLGLGRTAHEMRRGDDAFYYYFQVPKDSPRLPEALFEAAYASYEADEHETAVDLLDQLEANYPRSAFVDEAAILRGYVALSRCEFGSADSNFARFIDRFTPLLAHVDRLLENRARREQLYEQLLAGEHGGPGATPLQRTLLSLLRVDPEFYRLHEQVRALDAESARAGRIADANGVLLARLQGGDRPRAVAAEESTEAELVVLERDLELGQVAVRGLSDDLDALRSARTSAKTLFERERELARLADRLHELREKARALRARIGMNVGPRASSGKALDALIERDIEGARALPVRVAEVRAKLTRAASLRAEVALRELQERLRGLLRRARIGRIDAVMGSKRRVELQIESLAAGRFPAELRDPLRVQGLLDDDEEYWPFEGEDWPDEYEERYGESGGRGSR